MANVTQKEISIQEYAQTKESVQSLLNIMDLTNTEYDDRERIVNAIFTLMNEGEKSSDIRKSLIEDVVQNGVLRHYFSEQNKPLAVNVLNETSIETEAESVIYKLNFLIPDNDEFYELYQQSKGNTDKLKAVYKIPKNEILVQKVLECQKFLEEYNNYKKNKKSKSKSSLESSTLEIENDYTEGLNKLEDIMKRFQEQRKALTKYDNIGPEEMKETIKTDDTMFDFPEMKDIELEKKPKQMSEDKSVDLTPDLDLSDPKKELKSNETKSSKISVVSSTITIPEPPKLQKEDNIGELGEITSRIRLLSNTNKKREEEIEKLARRVQEQESQITLLKGDKASIGERYKESLNVIAALKQENTDLVSTNKQLLEFIKQISEELGMAQEPLVQEYDYKKIA